MMIVDGNYRKGAKHAKKTAVHSLIEKENILYRLSENSFRKAAGRG
jgi:hypothetical protein